MQVQEIHLPDDSTRVIRTPEEFQNLAAEEQARIKSVYPAPRHWEIAYYATPPLHSLSAPKQASGISPRLMLKILGYGSQPE